MAKYIDRESVYMSACKGCTQKGIEIGSCFSDEPCEKLIRGFVSAAAADVAPVVHGQWCGEGDGYAETEDGKMALVYDVWKCSGCGYIIDDGTDDPNLLPHYCPNCGAKMDGTVE